MTIFIESHIEELRAELRNACDQSERAEIRAELELAEAELTLAIAEQSGDVDAEPPFQAAERLQFPDCRGTTHASAVFLSILIHRHQG